MEELLNNDTAKEFLTYVSFFDEELLDRIPDELLENMNKLSAKSKNKYYVDKTKSLEEQNMSESCKDLLSILYYMYLSSSEERKLIDEENI